MHPKKRDLIITVLFIFITIVSHGSQSESREKGPDVIIIYSSGNPQGSISDLTADAVTFPTPKAVNVRTIAGQLSQALQKHGATVRVATASEVKNPEEILQSGIVVFGSPAYFNNISWELKKLIDEHFGRIYGMKNRLDGKRVAAFAMAEVIPSVEATLTVFRNTVNDCNGVFGPTLALLVKQTPEEVNNLIETFVDGIVGMLEKR